MSVKLMRLIFERISVTNYNVEHTGPKDHVGYVFCLLYLLSKEQRRWERANMILLEYKSFFSRIGIILQLEERKFWFKSSRITTWTSRNCVLMPWMNRFKWRVIAWLLCHNITVDLSIIAEKIYSLQDRFYQRNIREVCHYHVCTVKQLVVRKILMWILLKFWKV